MTFFRFVPIKLIKTILHDFNLKHKIFIVRLKILYVYIRAIMSCYNSYNLLNNPSKMVVNLDLVKNPFLVLLL